MRLARRRVPRLGRLAAIAMVAAAAALGGCSDDGDDEVAGEREPVPADLPTTVEIDTRFERGRDVAAEWGCLACHRIGASGNPAPGPELTEIGSRMSRDELARVLVNPTAPMPSFAGLRDKRPADFDELVKFLAALR